MVVLNNKKYNDYNVDISWGDFSIFSGNEKRSGVAPFITFNLNDNKMIGLELTFSKEMFEKMINGEKTNIEKYITDITYEDEKGWISLIISDCSCNIIRIDEKIFNIELCVKNDGIEEINISINTDITLL